METGQSKKPDVAVIMSTYNGEEYLKEQIDSIYAQNGVNVHLYVRDDGSSDSTRSILSVYRRAGCDIHLFFENNVGIGNSFMKCLAQTGSGHDYYAFSDQDDIWLPEKLLRAVELLNVSGKKLYCSNQICVDRNGIEIGMRYRSVPGYDVLDCLTHNQVSGCTFVFTNDFYRLITSRMPGETLLKKRIHDVWLAIIGALGDSIIYDPNSYILYRQHEDNVVGAFPDHGFKTGLKLKIEKIQNREKRNGRSSLAKEVFEKYPEYRANKIISYSAFSRTLSGKADLIRNSGLFARGPSRITFIAYVILELF